MASFLQVTLFQRYQQRDVINRFHYFFNGQPATVLPSFALASAFGIVGVPNNPGWVPPPGSPMQAIANLQPGLVQYAIGSAFDLWDKADFYETSFPVGTGGLRAFLPDDATLSAFVAFSLSSSRTTRAVKRGQKRFAGVLEGDNEAGGLVRPTLLANQLAPLATALSAVLEYNDEGNALTFQPAVLSYQEYDPPNGKPGRKAYKPWPDAQQQLAHAAVGVTWTPRADLTTQNSRKTGRGS